MPGNDARTEALIAGCGDVAIERVDATGSTNDDLLARVRAAAVSGATRFAPCLLVADHQRAGRGRHGRSWHAAPGRSLTCSIAWQLERSDLSGLSLAIGSALADALDEYADAPRIGLKWPNDLWLLDRAHDSGGRKLGGVLVETAPLGATRVAVVGVGINVVAQAVANAASGVAGVDEIDARATPASVLATIAPALCAALRRFDAVGFAAFAARFAARDLLRGRAVVGERGTVCGIACGVDASGALLVDTGAAGVVAVTSGEWRLRLAESAGAPC